MIFEDPTLMRDLLRTLCRIANQCHQWPWSDASPTKAVELLEMLREEVAA